MMFFIKGAGRARMMVLLTFLFICVINSSAQTVYVSETGKKYHAKNCPVAKTGKKGINLAEAKKLGYKPCKSCKADQIREKDPADRKKKPAATS